jgi:hypothetical protein
LPQEIQWILKIGIWAKTQISKHTKIGSEIASQFINYEFKRENRRKKPRGITKPNSINRS